MTKYTKIEQMVHEMFCTDDDKAIPWTASTSEQSKIGDLFCHAYISGLSNSV